MVGDFNEISLLGLTNLLTADKLLNQKLTGPWFMNNFMGGGLFKGRSYEVYQKQYLTSLFNIKIL